MLVCVIVVTITLTKKKFEPNKKVTLLRAKICMAKNAAEEWQNQVTVIRVYALIEIRYILSLDSKICFLGIIPQNFPESFLEVPQKNIQEWMDYESNDVWAKRMARNKR